MPISLIPFRKPTLNTERLPVVMSGVRMGERVLQIGIDDPAVAGAIAAKVGVSGRAAFAVADERAASIARKAAEDAMALADIEIASLPVLPFPDAAFDLVVVNLRSGGPATLDAAALSLLLREARRVLRSGGRLMGLQAGTPSGLSGWLRSSKSATPATDLTDALAHAGFRSVRMLADREGYLFTEGLRPPG